MNPLNAIRWKLLLVMGVIVTATLWLGMPGILDRALSEGIRAQLMTTSETGSISLSVLEGRLSIEELKIDDPQGGPEPLFTADAVKADISIRDLLRRKVVIETLHLDNPSVLITQNEDGTLSIENEEDKDLFEGVDPVEVARKAEELYGKWEDARDWVQRIRRLIAHREAREEVKREKGLDVQLEKTTPLPELEPRVVVKDIRISGVDVELEGPSNPPSIRSAMFQGVELNTAPLRHGLPMRVALQGLFGNESPATFLLKTTVKPDADDLLTLIERAEVANLDATFLGPILGETLPFRLTGGRLALRLDDGWIRNTESMKVKASLLVHQLKIEPRPGHETLAGFPAATLCQAVSDAGTFEMLATLTGSPLSPEVSLDNSMQLLMSMGAQAFAKQALRQLQSRYGGSVLAGLTGKTGLALPGILSGAEGGGIPGLESGFQGMLQQGGLTVPGAGGEASPLSALDGLIKPGSSGGDPMNAVNQALGGLLKQPAGKPGEKPQPGANPLDALKNALGGKPDPNKKTQTGKKPPAKSPFDILKGLQKKKKKTE